MTTLVRRRVYALVPCVALGAFFLTQQGCSERDASPPAHDATPRESSSRYSAADRALRHDVAYVAAAVARCRENPRDRECARRASADVANAGLTVKSDSLAVRGVVETILAQLPIKPVICAIAQSHGGGGNSDSGDTNTNPEPTTSDASTALDAGDAGASSSLQLFDVWGGTATSAALDAGDAGGASDAGTTADVAVAYDLARCQSAAFVHPGGGIDALLSSSGPYRGRGRGAADDVIQAFSGSYALTGEASLPTSVRKNEAPITFDLTSAPPLGGMPAPTATMLASLAAARAYAPWDEGTKALLALPFGQSPTLAGAPGAQYVQYVADAESGTTCGAQMAVAMLTQAGDEGDFSSSAGNGALTAIATGIALSLGIQLDAWCSDVTGSSSSSSSGSSGSSDDLGGQRCRSEANGASSCRSGLSCAWNGDEFCCRSEPKGNERCYSNDACQQAHGPGWVCGSRRVPGSETVDYVCTPKETCR